MKAKRKDKDEIQPQTPLPAVDPMQRMKDMTPFLSDIMSRYLIHIIMVWTSVSADKKCHSKKISPVEHLLGFQIETELLL